MNEKEKTRFAEPLQQVDRTYVLWRGRKLSYFGGCDYFRLSSHPQVLEAVSDGLDRFGLNVAASRKTTGNHRLYEQLERATARYFGADCARLVSNGYLTNIVAAQALRGTIEHALIDEHAHASLRDAAVFLGCKTTVFKHRDYNDAARKLKPSRRTALLTDGLFSCDGSLAPVRAYRQGLGAEVLLWIDDSHAAGVLGRAGEGSLEAAGLPRQNTVQTITFSKAFGVYGGAVLCDHTIGERIVDRSGVLVGNTPLPLPLAVGVLAALTFANATLRKKLARNVARFWSEIGVDPPSQTFASPIISFVPADPRATRAELLRAGIYPSLICYPGGPEQRYFRFALSSEHSDAQIRALASVVASAEILA